MENPNMMKRKNKLQPTGYSAVQYIPTEMSRRNRNPTNDVYYYTGKSDRQPATITK